MKQKIYEFQINGEKEWICADTVIEALKFYHQLTDIDFVDFDNEDDIVELPKEKWAEMHIIDPDCLDLDNNPVRIGTFAEYMEKQATQTDIIATTCY